MSPFIAASVLCSLALAAADDAPRSLDALTPGQLIEQKMELSQQRPSIAGPIVVMPFALLAALGGIGLGSYGTLDAVNHPQSPGSSPIIAAVGWSLTAVGIAGFVASIVWLKSILSEHGVINARIDAIDALLELKARQPPG